MNIKNLRSLGLLHPRWPAMNSEIIFAKAVILAQECENFEELYDALWDECSSISELVAMNKLCCDADDLEYLFLAAKTAGLGRDFEKELSEDEAEDEAEAK